MSTFYVLPPRAVLGDRFANFLQTIFPGLPWDHAMRVNLADALGAAATSHRDVYVVFREDIPAGEPLLGALADAFGAEPGDEVIEVRAAPGGGLHAERRRFPRLAA